MSFAPTKAQADLVTGARKIALSVAPFFKRSEGMLLSDQGRVMLTIGKFFQLKKMI